MKQIKSLLCFLALMISSSFVIADDQSPTNDGKQDAPMMDNNNSNTDTTDKPDATQTDISEDDDTAPVTVNPQVTD